MASFRGWMQHSVEERSGTCRCAWTSLELDDFAHRLRPGISDYARSFMTEGLGAASHAAAGGDAGRVERSGIGCGYDTYSTRHSGGRNDQTKQDTLDLHDHSIVKLMNAYTAGRQSQLT